MPVRALGEGVPFQRPRSVDPLPTARVASRAATRVAGEGDSPRSSSCLGLARLLGLRRPAQ